jgi:excisionase family DNA binding protein
MTTDIKLSFTILEAVTATGLSRSFLWQKIQSGELKTVRAGRRRLILANDLRNWIAGHPTSPI